MALQTVNFISQNPYDIFVIIVGEFHVGYGGGLPSRIADRLHNRGLIQNIVTISQIYTDGMTTDEINSEIQPSNLYGSRADFIWLSKP